jgi:hypothetical protein
MGKAHKEVRNKLKAKQNPLRKKVPKAVELADRIHTDLAEMQPGIEAYQHFLLLIDEYSRFIWAYPMKKKSEAPQIYARFEAMLKTQFGRVIKSLRSDNAGELTSDRFQDHLDITGTNFEASIAHAHEQNGLAERHIRTIKERILAVLADAKLPYRLWPEILKTVVWVKNRSPARILKNKTPYEALYKHRPNLSDLKIPGCKAYALIPPEKRHKADFKSSACRYLGAEATNQHRLYEEASGRVIYARDVEFDEDAMIEPIPDVQRQDAAPEIGSTPHTAMPLPSTASYEPPAPTQAISSLGGEIVDTTPNNEPPARVTAEEPKETPSQETTTADSQDLKRSERIRMPSRKLRETLEQLQNFSDPTKHIQIFRVPFDEHFSLRENETWVEIKKTNVPQGKQILPGRWIYKRKGDGRFKSANPLRNARLQYRRYANGSNGTSRFGRRWRTTRRTRGQDIPIWDRILNLPLHHDQTRHCISPFEVLRRPERAAHASTETNPTISEGCSGPGYNLFRGGGDSPASTRLF